MRRLIPVVAAWIVVACASAGAPPGGPEDHAPPQVLSITPDSGQLNVKAKEVNIRFDEVVAEQALGASNLDRLFLISPRSGEPSVSWHRSRLTITPHGGFKPNTAYRVTMLPGLADLRGNVRKDGLSIVFSTGASVPRLGIVGVVFDWAGERPAVNAYVEALLRTDTTLAYVSVTDSTGHFEIGPLDSGTYLVRGLIDQNNNRIVDRTEKWDTVSVPVSQTRPSVELDVIERDSLPPALAKVTAEDSVTLRLTFDKPLDPRITLQPALVSVRGADSSNVVVDRVQWATAFDAARRARDSARAAPDTTRGRGAPPPAARPTPPVGVPGIRPAPPPPKPKSPPPDRSLVVTLAPATPLVPLKSYRVTTRGLRNLVGHPGEQTGIFQVPRPAARDSTKRDTTSRARPDTVKPPGSKPPLR